VYTVNEKRKIITDYRFAKEEADARYDNHLFVRLSAKGTKFTNVDFRYTTFDACYLRDAKFDSCDFTGCRFVATNLNGAKFSGCRFEYATFERTMVDPAILDTECPSRENLRVRFARTLRMNYQQLGEAAAVNKAMKALGDVVGQQPDLVEKTLCHGVSVTGALSELRSWAVKPAIEAGKHRLEVADMSAPLDHAKMRRNFPRESGCRALPITAAFVSLQN
jgi:uncharacterized protein YjbI with pentapeptide repeats